MKKFFPALLFVSLLFVSFAHVSKTQAAEDFWDDKINVSLSYLPESPINNPANPTEISISARVAGKNPANEVSYTWIVYGSTKKSNPGDWEEILKKDLVEVSKMSGFGVDELRFKLAFDKDLRFIRVKLDVTETTSLGNINEGTGDIIIPLNSISNELSAYSVSATDSGIAFKDQICLGANEDSPCTVIKNEIIGLRLDSSKLTDFTWKIDGDPFEYNQCPLSDCDSNEAVFPVLKDAQEKYEVEVSANIKETGKMVYFKQYFVVTEPSSFIESEDKTTCAPILLGYFKDLDDNLTPDYSKSEFEAIAGSTVKLNPNFKVQNIDDISWTIDIASVTKQTAEQYGLVINGREYGIVINDDGSISFPSDTEVGYSYDVTFSTLYTPNKATKKALNKYWGVGLNDFYEKLIDATIKINVVEYLESSDEISTLPESKKNTTLAALLASAPSQLLFLIKIVLISFVLLFSSYFIFSLFPKTKK